MGNARRLFRIGSPDEVRACPLLKWVELRLRGAGGSPSRANVYASS